METTLHKRSVRWAALGRYRQVSGTKTLALEIRPKEGAGAGYMGENPGLAMWKQPEETSV